MKKGIVCLLITLCYFITHAQNVGIGTTTPKARLHVLDSSVLFSAADPTLAVPGNTPLNGAGARMMWYPGKAAFRTGYINGAQWDKDSIGYYSFAAGANNRALGYSSTSMGDGTIASGDFSTSMGGGTIASGPWSTSMGSLTNASQYYATSMGYRTNASGASATSMGLRTTGSGDNSTSMGYLSTASGNTSVSMGYQTIASGDYSTSIGFFTRAKAMASFAAGIYNDEADNPDPFSTVATDRIFQIGNGIEFARRNALTILRNGNIGIGTVTPSAPLSFSNSFGTKISLYHGSYGDVGIGVEGGELRLQNDIPNGKVSMGVIETTGSFTELARAQRNGTISFTVNGSLMTNSTLYPSDERFKQNIVAISSPLQKIQQLNGVEYEMRVSEFPQYHFVPGRQIGLLAQNLEKVIPEAVNELDGFKGVDYAKLVPLLIEGIKEQQKQIEITNEEVKQLRQQQIKASSDEVKQLQQQVTELKKLVEQLIKK